MKNVKRLISAVLCLVLCLSILLFGAGCDSDRAALLMYNPPEKYIRLATSSVAENNRYSLIWDNENERVVLYDKIEKVEWSYVSSESMNPSFDYDKGYDVTVRPYEKSPITIEYYNLEKKGNETDAHAWSSCMDEKEFPKNEKDEKFDTYTVNKINNGVELVFYFTQQEITVPVQFTLVNDGVEVSVDPTKIEEGNKYAITTVTIAPLFCNVSNKYVGNKDHYLFIPSGSGALLYPSFTNGGSISTAKYEEAVYGGDANIDKEELLTVTENVRVPVYGAVNGDKAVCAIIKEGAEFAKINTVETDQSTLSSFVNSKFVIRGYQQANKTLFASAEVEAKLYADAFTADKIRVGFYPLYDDDASYVGMANKYREYLEETKALDTANRSNDSLLNIKLVGGITSKKFIFGIPTQSMLTATTIEQAQSIVSDIKNRTNLGNFNVNLVGFGASGNDVGKVAGNYKVAGVFGDKKDISSLTSYCDSNGINLFMNFDMLRFNASGGGVSTGFDKAESASGSYTTKDYYSPNFRSPENKSYYLVTRSKLASVAQNIKSAAADYALKGVSLDSLTSIVYSDYSENEYYSGANTEAQFKKIIENFTSSKYKVAGSDANAYLAGLCDHIYDVPTKSSGYISFDVDVPFYEIVFKGYVSMSGASLNLATNKNDTLLKAVESGTGLTYTLVGEYDTNLISSYQNVFYGSVYYDETLEIGVRDDLVKTVNDYKAYFNSVNGATIIDHKVVADGVNKTTFDNGVSVYVNYTDKEFIAPDGTTVAAGGFKSIIAE